jgi:peptidylamidoglycolate lyase
MLQQFSRLLTLHERGVLDRRQLLGALVAMAATPLLLASAGCNSAAPKPPPESQAAPAGYHVVHGWPQLPEGRDLGEVSGVGVDADGKVFVFHRNDRSWPDSDRLSLDPITAPAVTVFDGRTGKILAEWGADTFAMPHGLTVDAEGNVWLTDVALQQVFKYSHDGKLLMTLGERGVAGNDSGHFDRPTKVAVAPDGSFYVSDGYRNTRVMKFTADGAFLFQWGTPGTGPGQFDLVHSVTLDREGQVYVSDRSNGRVQVFDGNGKFLAQWKSAGIGRPYDVGIGPDGTVFIADGGDQPAAPPDRSALVVAHHDGTVIERVGRWGNYDGQLEIAHDIAVGPDGAVYLGDITGRRIQKFVSGGAQPPAPRG